MLAFLMAIPGLLTGIFGTVNNITNAIANEKIAALTAQTQDEKIHADERVATLQQRRDVLIADAAHGSWDIWIRTSIAIGPACYLLKIFLYDKVFQSVTHGSTDPLDPNLWVVVQTVLGFYFLSETSIRIGRMIAARK